MNSFDRISVLLSVQRALVGTINRAVVRADVAWSEKEIHLVFYVLKDISEDETDYLEEAVTMVTADFWHVDGINIYMSTVDSDRAKSDGSIGVIVFGLAEYM